MLKKTLLIALALLVLLPVVAVGRALSLSSPQAAFRPEAPIPLPEFDARGAAMRLAESLTFMTLSFPPPMPMDTATFRGLHDFLEARYPRVHSALTRERVNGLSLLYTWRGTDPSLDPAVLMGHLDVVPVVPGTEVDWAHGPFEGVVADGFVWGRGAIDNKSSVLGVLEAVELLLAEGYQPTRTFYLAFGHDEEIGGPRGAAALADTIARRSPKLAFVVDEGGAVVEDAIPGVDGAAAMVGVAEKGYVSLRLSASGEGGHSSVPPATTNVGLLARAIHRLEEDPFPMELDGPTRAMLETVAPDASFGFRVILGNLWLFGPLVKAIMGGEPTGAATLRTTTAATIFNGGVKDNVLPINAEAVVNFRIRPGETVESTMDRVRAVIDDERVEIEIAYEGASQDPSPVSDPTGAAYAVLARTIQETLSRKELLVVPYLVVGGTDAKYYAGRSENVFRFLPVNFGDAGISAIHGTDERISVEDFATAIQFFRRLILNAEEL